LSWGEVELPLAISVPELREINVPPGVTPLDTLPAICLYRLGRKSEIDPMYQVPEMFDLGRSDLRFSPHAGRIRGLLGARVSDSYFATAMRYGYDPRRFYEGGERTLLLCAYCNGPVDETTVDCPSCGLDVRKDALVEASNVQLALERRKKCRACAGPMVQTASVCPGCRTRQ
jgi:RNA polymerase subunit RPABC4/transcription elongation factor Spt4